MLILMLIMRELDVGLVDGVELNLINPTSILM